MITRSLSMLLLASVLSACHAAPTPQRPTPVAAPTVEPAPKPAPPRPPAWPVPVTVLRWGAGGLEPVGTLPGQGALPTTPWLVEPVATTLDAAQLALLLGELRAHDVPGLALRDRVVPPIVLAALRDLPALRYLDLSGAEVSAGALASLDPSLALTRLYLTRTGLDDAAIAAAVARQRGLEVLEVGDTWAGDATATAASALPALRALSMAGTALTDRGGATLGAATHLEVVDLMRTAVGDVTARALVNLPLQEAYLGRTAIGRGVRELAPLAHSIIRVDLSDLAVDDGAVAWLEQAGGLIEANLGGTKVGDLTARRLATLPALREVDLAETKVGPAGALALAAVVGLERVDLAATGVDDVAVHALLAAPALAMLRLDDTAIGDPALVGAHPRALRELYLARTKVGDAGLALLDDTPGLVALGVRRTAAGPTTIARIARLSELRTLDVGQLALPYDHLAALAPLTRLERLYLDQSRSGDVTFAAIAGNRLRVLHMQQTDLSDQSLDALAALPLEELSVGDTRLTVALLDRLPAWPRLRTLSLVGLGLEDDAVPRLVSARRLQTLDLSSTAITAPGPLVALEQLRVLGLSQLDLDRQDVVELAGLPRLAELYLAGTPLTRTALPVLAGIRGLRKLDLRGTKITAREAQRALPKVELAR